MVGKFDWLTDIFDVPWAGGSFKKAVTVKVRSHARKGTANVKAYTRKQLVNAKGNAKRKSKQFILDTKKQAINEFKVMLFGTESKKKPTKKKSTRKRRKR